MVNHFRSDKLRVQKMAANLSWADYSCWQEWLWGGRRHWKYGLAGWPTGNFWKTSTHCFANPPWPRNTPNYHQNHLCHLSHQLIIVKFVTWTINIVFFTMTAGNSLLKEAIYMIYMINFWICHVTRSNSSNNMFNIWKLCPQYVFIFADQVFIFSHNMLLYLPIHQVPWGQCDQHVDGLEGRTGLLRHRP